MRAETTNMKGTTLRGLFAQIPNVLKACCPCMLMSPTSVSQFLDIDMEKFDLVIFDEASQVPTCKAVGSIVRGKNVIVVGDPKQLPPTTFFSSDYKDDEHFEVEDLESILDDCLALGMPENHLLWHYRSNHESLIAFSNAMYYDNTLLTFPSPNELNSKVSFKYVDGVYERGGSKCNRKEGDALVAEVIARLKDPAQRGQSIGIVTFNTAQQNYIENELNKLIHRFNLEAPRRTSATNRSFVKNLESVQGDERDVILFSVGYAPDANGKLSLNFGPINQAGGYKRLNVAVTRARNEMKVFSGITGNMIDLNRTDSKGVAGLKAFLEYAERGREMLAISSEDITSARGGIGELVAAELRDKGILCDYNVGGERLQDRRRRGGSSQQGQVYPRHNLRQRKQLQTQGRQGPRRHADQDTEKARLEHLSALDRQLLQQHPPRDHQDQGPHHHPHRKEGALQKDRARDHRALPCAVQELLLQTHGESRRGNMLLNFVNEEKIENRIPRQL